MRDRSAVLSGVFGYGLLAWSVVSFLTSLPEGFPLEAGWPYIVKVAVLSAVTALLGVFWLKILRRLPYGWMAAIALAMSVLFAWLGAMELSRAMELSTLSVPSPVAQPLITIPIHIVAAASGLFALANIVAIIITARAGGVQPDSAGPGRQDQRPPSPRR